ncbi:Bdr family repetitive protein [Borrelia puertoricensis]|uniref:Bdr family repetitive protein n=1 Tax=Borrelia puertoricensis TaxID=2756107 RepID=UPI001FF222D7|nr:Bdr family repetitive protein [Borrelia puertoricensis]UPA18601.1 DUF1640 domain-containing protein [Borrelia puertoricensis]
MGNLAYKIYRTEDLRNEFLHKGFTEEAVDFILLHNDNSNFEVLREKMNSLEQQIINVENNLKKDIEFTKVEFKRDIANLDIKIDNIEKNLLKEIQNNNAVLLEKLNTGNRIIYLMIIGIGIFFPIISSLINKYFIN